MVERNCEDQNIVTQKKRKTKDKRIKSIIKAVIILLVFFCMINTDPSDANPLSVPYIHQVCDTPDDFNGCWSCGATSAVMILAYHNKLDKWPFCPSLCTPQPRISNYGRYVSEQYPYNGYIFDTMTYEPEVGTCNSNYLIPGDPAYGAYGFIHHPTGSADRERTKKYFELHGLSSKVIEYPEDDSVVKAEIIAGRPVWASTNLWPSGHIVVIKGSTYQGNSDLGHSCDVGCFIVNDPWPRNTQSENREGESYRYTWSEMQIGSKWIVTAIPNTMAISYGGIKSDWARSIQQTSDGGFIMAGQTSSFGAGNGDLWVLKLKSDGSFDWQRTYGGSAEDYAFSIQQTSDGGYAVVGYTASFGSGKGDIWVLKLDQNGDVGPSYPGTWQKTYGGGNYDYGYFIQQTFDQKPDDLHTPNGYILAGMTSSFGAGGYDMWILKLNLDGTIAWQKTYGSTGFERPLSVQQTFDQQSSTSNGYIAGGYTTSFGASNNDLWVLKLDLNGNVGPNYPGTWQKTYSGTGSERAHSIQQTSEGGYIVAGQTSSFGAGADDLWVLKLREDGTVDWQKTYGGTNSEQEGFIQQTTDGGYIVADYTSSFGVGDYDALVLKLKSDGTVDWQKTYGGPGSDYALFIQQTSEDGYVVTGATNSFGAGSDDAWVLKLDSNGDINGCPIVKTSDAITDDSNAFVNNTTVTGVNTNISPKTSTALMTDANLEPNFICQINLDDGLVAYYPFNGNADDESGNGNHGTVFGATLTTDRFEYADRAYSFDGTNDYISVQDIPELSGGSPLVKSVSLWFKVDNFIPTKPGYTPIITKYKDASSKDWGLIIRSGKLTFYSEKGGPYADYYCSQTTGEILTNVWYHGVFVVNEPNIYIYANGQLVGSCSDATGKSIDTTTPVTIGAIPYASDYYSGIIDDIRIYNRILTEAEIGELSSEAPYTLNVSIDPAMGGSVSGSGINCPGYCTEFYEPCADVTLNATANSGYAFSSWLGCNSTSGVTCYITMDEDINVTANFCQLNIYYRDADGDGYGNPNDQIQACTQPTGYVTNNSDCNDIDNEINPNGSEICDGKNNDCDDNTPDGSGESWYGNSSSCGVGVCSSTGQLTCLSGNQADTCTPGSPTETPEISCGDGLDNDCDGAIDYVDKDCDIKGDINKDGSVDISDVILVLRIALVLDDPKPCSDINNDGNVDISDVILTLRMALGLDTLKECIYIDESGEQKA